MSDEHPMTDEERETSQHLADLASATQLAIELSTFASVRCANNHVIVHAMLKALVVRMAQTRNVCASSVSEYLQVMSVEFLEALAAAVRQAERGRPAQ